MVKLYAEIFEVKFFKIDYMSDTLMTLMRELKTKNLWSTKKHNENYRMDQCSIGLLYKITISFTVYKWIPILLFLMRIICLFAYVIIQVQITIQIYFSNFFFFFDCGSTLYSLEIVLRISKESAGCIRI